jgi:hypothetical protein
MRKIAREAVIFTLLGIALYGAFITLYYYQLYHNTSWALGTNQTLFLKLFDVVMPGLVAGFMYGAPLGLCVWIFYRVVRFAVKG